MGERARLLVFLGAFLAFFGCGRGGEKSSQPLVALVTNSPSDFWSLAKRGAEDAAREGGGRLEFRIPETGTAEQQQSILENLLALGVSGVAISPANPAHQGPMLKRVGERATLLCTDSDAPDSGRLAYVGTDNVAAGRLAGEAMKAALPGGGDIVLFVGTLEAANARERRQGIEEVFAGSTLRVVDVRTDATDRALARSNVENVLASSPNVRGLIGLWSYNGPQILAAVRAAGRLGTIAMVAFDEEPDTLRGVQEGHLAATIVQQPYRFGFESVKLLLAIGRGDRSGLPAHGRLEIPARTIRAHEVAAFESEMKELRR